MSHHIVSNMSLRACWGAFLAHLVLLSLATEVRLHSLPPQESLRDTSHSVLMFDEHLDNSSTPVRSSSNKTESAEVSDGSSILKKINTEQASNEDKNLKVLKSSDPLPNRKAQVKTKSKSATKKTITAAPTTEENIRTSYSTASVTTELPVEPTLSAKLPDLLSSESSKSLNSTKLTLNKEISKSNTARSANETVSARITTENYKSVSASEGLTITRKKYTNVDRSTTAVSKIKSLASPSTTTRPVLSVSSNEPLATTAATSTTTPVSSTTPAAILTSSAATVATHRSAVTTVLYNSTNQSPEVNQLIEGNRTPVVSSKRGGFIDNSVKTNTTVDKIKKDNVNDTSPVHKKNYDDSNYGSIFGIVDSPSNDKRNIYTVSQNEMIEEALLAEKMLYETETFIGRKKHKMKTSSEEQQQVKPTSNKNNSLYAVNPNYKPLKKLDVSIPKPYHKHPDDNSWRNESISQTLGIVFNPNNSSKPLTEVLKNKTEFELGILERENITSDTPDLRERLEKLTEMRKAKKSKSDEDVRSGTWHSGIFDNYEDSVSTPKVDLSSPLSRNQQKLLDYYEHDEDNEADYFSLANIEINKRKKPASGDRKESGAEYAVSTGQFPAERKPSVQYFPPRTTTGRPPPPRHIDPGYRFTSRAERTTPPPRAPTDPDINYYDSPPKSRPSGSRYNMVKQEYALFRSDRLEPPYAQEADRGEAPYAKDLSMDGEAGEGGEEEFPVVYRSSVVHSAPEREPRLLASSGASVRQLYEQPGAGAGAGAGAGQGPGEGGEHEPDYSVHYYVPGGEDLAVPSAFL